MGTIEDLRERTRGPVFTDGDEGYDEAQRVLRAFTVRVSHSPPRLGVSTGVGVAPAEQTAARRS